VILVTSLDSPEEQEKGLLLGADAYIVKRKFDQKELLRVVRQIV
jgi:two-component system chemotaxis sensor kinase CheA